MKYRSAFFALSSGILLGGCFSSDGGSPIVSQKFVHKYGFDVTPEEWEERDREGQVVEMLASGIKVVRSYENGVLHGPTSFTYPNSNVIEKLQVFDQGNLLKEVQNDSAGMPMMQQVYEFDNRTITTVWDENGAPLSIEEFEGEKLVDGKYYNSAHELEGQVTGGFGERVKRDRIGLLLSRDTIQKGIVTSKTTYHATGEVHTISHFRDRQLHGEQLKFTSTGKPLMKLSWDNGVLNGPKIVYRNGTKVAEIPYVKGHKQGTEIHFDDLGNLTAEIEWQSDKKHGASKFYGDDTTEQEWFYRGQAVALDKYEMLSNRDRLLADLRRE